MSWDRPDQEPGTIEASKKPYCTTRPAPYGLGGEGDKLLKDYLKSRGLKVQTALKNHWYVSTDAGDPGSAVLRVVIPCTSRNLSNRFWQARRIDDASNAPRYQSPAGCSRGDALAVVHPRGDAIGTCLVEGPFDALAAADVGYLGIAWMGKAPGAEPIQLAQRLVKEPIYVISDRDAADAAVNIWRHFPGAFLVDPYPHKDFAEMSEPDRKVLLGRW